MVIDGNCWYLVNLILLYHQLPSITINYHQLASIYQIPSMNLVWTSMNLWFLILFFSSPITSVHLSALLSSSHLVVLDGHPYGSSWSLWVKTEVTYRWLIRWLIHHCFATISLISIAIRWWYIYNIIYIIIYNIIYILLYILYYIIYIYINYIIYIPKHSFEQTFLLNHCCVYVFRNSSKNIKIEHFYQIEQKYVELHD